VITARDVRRVSKTVPRGRRRLRAEFRAAIERRCARVPDWTGIEEPVLDRMADGELLKMSSTMLVCLAWLAQAVGYEGDFLEPRS
jgi:hypothetical protein